MKVGLLLSGGMDSTALAWWTRPDIVITIDYGQVCAEAEIEAAKAISQNLSLEHHIIRVDCSNLGSGDLAGRPHHYLNETTEWWPFRNQLLITLAAMRAISLGISRLLVATVRSDRCHKDGDPFFIKSLSELISFQEGNIKIEAPAIELSSAQLVMRSGVPPRILAWAHSCHKANVACGACRGCYKQENVYEALGRVYTNV